VAWDEGTDSQNDGGPLAGRAGFVRAKRRDGNHKTIGDYLRAQGWSVLDIADHGDGVPDYAVSKPRFAALVEVKDPEQPPSKRKLTEKEQKVKDDWQGPYVIAETGEQAHADLCVAMLGVQ
jgi:hypothetical protein